MGSTAGWLVVVVVLIALAFGVVLWRLWDPERDEALDRESRLPLEDVGESDLDSDGDSDLDERR